MQSDLRWGEVVVLFFVRDECIFIGRASLPWQRSGRKRKRGKRGEITSPRSMLAVSSVCNVDGARCFIFSPYIEQKRKERRKAKSTRTLVDHSSNQRRREKQAYCVYFSFQTESTGHFTSVVFIETIFSVRIDTHCNLGLQLPIPSPRPTVKPIAARHTSQVCRVYRSKLCLWWEINTDWF